MMMMIMASQSKSWDTTGAPEKNVKLAARARDGWDNVEFFESIWNESCALSLSLGAVALSSGCFLGWFQVTFLCCSAGLISSRKGPSYECQGLDRVAWENMYLYLFWFGMGPSRQTRLLNLFFLLRATRRAAEGETFGRKGGFWMQETTWEELPDFASLVWRRGGLGVAV